MLFTVQRRHSDTNCCGCSYTHQLTDVLTEREYRHDVCRADDGVLVSVCKLLSVDHKSSIVLTASLTK